MEVNLGVTANVLDAMALRAKAAMHNIANQNTPGFKRYRVEFEELLRRADADGTSSDVAPRLVRDESGLPGKNNVDMLEEMAVLNKVALLHDVFSRRAASHFAKLNTAIHGR